MLCTLSGRLSADAASGAVLPERMRHLLAVSLPLSAGLACSWNRGWLDEGVLSDPRPLLIRRVAGLAARLLVELMSSGECSSLHRLIVRLPVGLSVGWLSGLERVRREWLGERAPRAALVARRASACVGADTMATKCTPDTGITRVTPTASDGASGVSRPGEKLLRLGDRHTRSHRSVCLYNIGGR